MKQTRRIYLLDAAPAATLQETQRIAHPFLPTIEESFAAYETPAGDALYRIFGQDFLLSAEHEKGVRARYGGCTRLHRKIVAHDAEKLPDEEISRDLRGSASLRIDAHNCFTTGRGVKIVFSPHGVHISREWIWKGEEQKNQDIWAQDAEKAIECYLLALACQKKVDALLQRAIAAFDSGSAKKMIAARNELCAFDLKYFFANPVRMEVFETHALWRMAAQHCGVAEAHDEIKSQVLELAAIIENHRQRFFDVFFTIVGTLLAAASLLGALKSFG